MSLYTSSSYSRDELPIAALLLKRAWEFVLETEASRGSDGDQAAAEPAAE